MQRCSRTPRTAKKKRTRQNIFMALPLAKRIQQNETEKKAMRAARETLKRTSEWVKTDENIIIYIWRTLCAVASSSYRRVHKYETNCDAARTRTPNGWLHCVVAHRIILATHIIITIFIILFVVVAVDVDTCAPFNVSSHVRWVQSCLPYLACEWKMRVK